MEWKPFETAPKTATPILVHGSHGPNDDCRRITIAVWDEAAAAWVYDDDAFENPTHWGTLPPAPQPIAPDGKGTPCR